MKFEDYSPEAQAKLMEIGTKPNWNTLMPALRRWYCSCMSVANHGKQLVASSVSRVKLLVCDMPRWKDHGNNSMSRLVPCMMTIERYGRAAAHTANF